MRRKLKRDSRETDALRLDDLAREHGLPFKRAGMVYRFEDYTAFGLDQALGYVEGYDRAIASLTAGRAMPSGRRR